MKIDFSKLDSVRAKAFSLLDRAPGVVGDVARKVNEGLGRPLAQERELAERRAFANGEPAPSSAAKTETREAAPVVIYHLDKQRRDVPVLTQILDDAGSPSRVLNLEGDPAALSATRRDSAGHRLPVVFIAGEAIGGRVQLLNLKREGLQKLVFGS